MIRSFKYRLFTNANQERELAIALETHRRLWNEALSYRQMAWDCCRASVSFVDQSRWFTGQRRTNPFYARLNFHSAEQTLRRLDRAYDAFFSRGGFPRFKGKDAARSITYRWANGAKLIGNRLRVQHVGTIRVKLHRPIEGTVKTVTLKLEAGKWYVVFACEIERTVAPSVLPPVGVDVGLRSFLTTSDGDAEPNPRFLKSDLPHLRRLQRSLARKKRGGSNRRKAVKVLSVAHARIRNVRREHHHQVALRLVRRYGLIAVESLNVRGMVKSRRFSRAISDAGWSSFVNILRCKAEDAGARVVEVDPRGTSLMCSGCGEAVPKDLSVRQHDCPSCGLSLDRDHNAARNVLARGLAACIGPPQVNVGHKVKRSARSRKSV